MPECRKNHGACTNVSLPFAPPVRNRSTAVLAGEGAPTRPTAAFRTEPKPLRSRVTTIPALRVALLLPSAHPICDSFIEIKRAHDSLYIGTPHVVSDSVAHARKREADTSLLQLFDET